MKDIEEKQRVYLNDIHAAILRIETYAEGGEETFFHDGKTQDAIIRQISIIGEAVAKLPESLKSKYSEIPWKDIVGMRNIVIHDYADTDLPSVWETVERDLPLLKRTVEKILSS